MTLARRPESKVSRPVTVALVPAAWSGTTQAGGLELPGEVAGLVVLDELVIHGWDIARASGQPYDCDPRLLDVVHDFVAQFSEPGQEAARAGLFGPVVDVADDALLLDRVIRQAGVDLYLNNTMSIEAAASFSVFECSRIPCGVWDRSGFWITGHRGLAESILSRRHRWLARPLRLHPPGR